MYLENGACTRGEILSRLSLSYHVYGGERWPTEVMSNICTYFRGVVVSTVRRNLPAQKQGSPVHQSLKTGHPEFHINVIYETNRNEDTSWWSQCSTNSKHLTGEMGKYICSILPARRERQYFFPRKDVFAWPNKEGLAYLFTFRREQQEFFLPWINVHNIYLFYYLIRYLFPGGNWPQNRYFKEWLSLTALVTWSAIFNRLFHSIHSCAFIWQETLFVHTFLCWAHFSCCFHFCAYHALLKLSIRIKHLEKKLPGADNRKSQALNYYTCTYCTHPLLSTNSWCFVSLGLVGTIMPGNLDGCWLSKPQRYE